MIFKFKLILLLLLFLSSCTSLDYRLDERKDLLLKIIENPDSLTSIVKSSRFYDSSIYNNKLDIKLLSDENIERPNNLIVNLIKRLKGSDYDFNVDYCQDERYYLRKPEILSGETYNDVGSIMIKHHIIGVTFKKERIGIGIDYIEHKGKFYFLYLFSVTPEDEYKYLNKFGL